jgi:hypothetical protein
MAIGGQVLLAAVIRGRREAARQYRSIQILIDFIEKFAICSFHAERNLPFMVLRNAPSAHRRVARNTHTLTSPTD